jgi:hypothetical protein
MHAKAALYSTSHCKITIADIIKCSIILLMLGAISQLLLMRINNITLTLFNLICWPNELFFNIKPEHFNLYVPHVSAYFHNLL